MSRFDTDPSDAVDIEEPYDIYVSEGRTIVVYRKAFFRSIARLAATQRHEMWTDFLEIMQSNGSSVFVRRHGVMKFCEPGTTLEGETIVEKTDV